MTTDIISDRASVLLKALVERHIRDGQPVGSRTLMEEAGLPVSAATIRNVMSDLEERGYLVSDEQVVGGKVRKYYVITEQGTEALAEARVKIRELVDEVLEETTEK